MQPAHVLTLNEACSRCHVAEAGGVQGKRTGKTEQRDSLFGLWTVLFAGLTVVLVLIPLLGPIM
jgi:hypothetical protein